MSLVYKMIDSPVGKLKLIASREGLVAIFWGRDKPSHAELGSRWFLRLAISSGRRAGIRPDLRRCWRSRALPRS